MERNKITDKINEVNLTKLISNHINYLENEILVYENILDEISTNKVTENLIENLKNKENIHEENSAENFNNYDFYYLKYQEEEIEKINFIFFCENEKVKKRLNQSQKQLEDYKYQINLASNEINEISKQKKILEEKVFIIIIIF